MSRPAILVNGAQPPPLGDAADGVVTVGSTATLTLESTTGITSVVWAFEVVPEGSTCAPADPTALSTTATFDLPGEYVLTCRSQSGRRDRVTLRVYTAARELLITQPTDPAATLHEAVNRTTRAVDALVATASTTQHVASVAALRVSTPGASGAAILAGRVARGDGGGGVFYYDPADTTAADDGALTVVTEGGHRFKRVREGRVVNVRWFGATGDGTTDDTLACVAAVAAMGDGDVLYFPPGRYKLDWKSGAVVGNLAFRALTGITVRGDGPESVIYDARPSGNYNGESVGGAAIGAGTPTLNGTSDTAGTLSFFDCSNVTVCDLRIESTATGTETTTQESRKAIYAPSLLGWAHVCDCEFGGIYGEVVYLLGQGTVTAWVERNTVDDCPSNHVNLSTGSQASQWFVRDNVLRNSRTASPILIANGAAIVEANFLTCTLDQHSGDKITIGLCERFVVSRNVIAGITAAPATDAALIRIWYPTTEAATCDGVIADNVLVDNRIGTWSANGAILLGKAPSGQILVTGNVVVGNGNTANASPAVCIRLGNDDGPFTQGCVYVIEGNVFGRGARNQEIGVRVYESAAAFDVRVGDNVYNCTTPLATHTGATSTALAPSGLGQGSYVHAQERVAGLAYYAGASKAHTACRPVSFSLSDATPTAVQAYTPPSDCVVTVSASVSLVKSDASDAWAAEAVRRFRVVGGAVTALSAASVTPDPGNTAAAALDIDTSSGAIRVMVTGVAGQTWRGVAETGLMVRTTAA